MSLTASANGAFVALHTSELGERTVGFLLIEVGTGRQWRPFKDDAYLSGSFWGEKAEFVAAIQKDPAMTQLVKVDPTNQSVVEVLTFKNSLPILGLQAISVAGRLFLCFEAPVFGPFRQTTMCLDPSSGLASVIDHNRDLGESMIGLTFSAFAPFAATDHGVWALNIAKTFENPEEYFRAIRRPLFAIEGLAYKFIAWSPNGTRALFQGTYDHLNPHKSTRISRKNAQGVNEEIRSETIEVFDALSRKSVYRRKRVAEEHLSFVRWSSNDTLVGIENKAEQLVSIDIRTGQVTSLYEGVVFR